MGDSLWVLVDRYDQTIQFIRVRMMSLVEAEGSLVLIDSYHRVFTDLVALREDAASACEKLEGPRAA